MTDKTKNPASDLFDQALQNYEQALRTGLKLHEEAGRLWTKLANQASSPQDWQKQVAAVADEAIPATQKTMEDYLEFLEQNSHASVALLKKGIDAAQTTGLQESQAKIVDFCESSLKALKSSAQAIVEINGKAVDSWFGMVKKAANDLAEQKVEHV